MAVRTYMHAELADLCNFKCVFCPTDKRSHKMFDIEEYKKVLDVAKDTPILGVWYNWVQLNGNGEPLMHPQLVEAVKIAKARFPFCEFISNGSSVDRAESPRVIRKRA